MSIRKLEIPAEPLRPIAEAWLKETHGDDFGLEVSIENHLADLTKMVAAPHADVLLLCKGDGIIGYMGLQVFRSPIGGQTIANEHYWYVLPTYRGRGALELLNAADEWAKEKGCTHIMMNASMLASDLYERVVRIYQHRGFKEFETTFIKELGNGML